MKHEKIVGISMGDPAGIGPEIVLKSFPYINDISGAVPLIIGDESVLLRNMQILKCETPIKVHPEMGPLDKKKLNLLDVRVVRDLKFTEGTDSALCGNASFSYVTKAIDLFQSGLIDALVTLPISKKAWDMAGKSYSGHTELLTEKFGVKFSAMIMAAGNIRTLLVTTHIPLKRVPALLTQELILNKISLGFDYLYRLSIKKPIVLVAALNPHGGEGGLIGDEEEDIIKPALKRLAQLNMECRGPFPADAVFKKAFNESADMIICMYHDQALIPLKSFYPEKLVNITAGLPVIRTSPGHGTAFDISYKNKADPLSFIEAYRTALKINKCAIS